MNNFSKALGMWLLACICLPQLTIAQGSTISKDGQEINTITTAVPFLRIIPDARSGGMGDVGIAMSPDANGIYLNPSKMAFVEDQYGVGLTFTPWLKSLVNDIYLANMSGYYKLDEGQTIAGSFRYFSLGQITFTNEQAETTGEFRPNEFAFDGHYARKFSDNFALGVSLRYIYSNLAKGQQVNAQVINAGHAAAGDISLTYRTPIELNDMDTRLTIGANLSNLGSKMTYTDNAQNKDFIPANMGIGVGWELNIDEYNKINFYADVNRLLVPTPDTADADDNGIFDYREKSSVSGIFSSFNDAPGGFGEEMREFMYSVGAEYWYDEQFAVRTGYFHEHSTKGNRRFLSAGLGLKYNVFGLNFSYLVPVTSQRNPLDNTLRFTLLFNFAETAKE